MAPDNLVRHGGHISAPLLAADELLANIGPTRTLPSGSPRVELTEGPRCTRTGRGLPLAGPVGGPNGSR